MKAGTLFPLVQSDRRKEKGNYIIYLGYKTWK